MKNIFFIISSLVFMVSCEAQTLPLNTFMENIPNNAYVKDLNNELQTYVGVYKANFEGNEIPSSGGNKVTAYRTVICP